MPTDLHFQIIHRHFNDPLNLTILTILSNIFQLNMYHILELQTIATAQFNQNYYLDLGYVHGSFQLGAYQVQ